MTENVRHTMLAGEAMRIDDRGSPVLLGSRCEDCGARTFPPARVCPECMSENMAEVELSNVGSLYAFSMVHVAPRGWKVPYIAGYVDLPEGVRVFTHVTNADPEHLEMDMPVQLTTAVLRHDDEAVESYAFEPLTV